MMKRIFCITLALIGLLTLATPKTTSAYTTSADSIHSYISVLASDSLEGRETGEVGEQKAAGYIVEKFKAAGLEPKGDDGSYYQPFDFVKRIETGPNTSLTVNGTKLEPNVEFQPMLQTADTKFDFNSIVSVGYGITTEDSTYDDYAGKDVAGKAVLIKRFSPPADTKPGVDFDKYAAITDKVINAMDHDVSGIFLITPEDQDDTLMSVGFTHVTPKDIPIIWIRRKGLEKLGLSLTDPQAVSAVGQTEMVRVRDTGYNIVGYLPGTDDSTIIIGAHYDHLGYGGPASRYTGTDRKIHPGADDNGSGTAALLELARNFGAKENQLHHSLLFIAFSGEEKGILGSSYYAKHMTVDTNTVRMMINMDMIGRLREQDKGLMIMGTGTCPEFKHYFDSVLTTDMKLTLRESGTGPSDHTAFYNRDIPVLFFFTGAHEDYHTPRDVVDKIDFNGVAKVADLVADITTYFDNYGGPLTFQKTKGDSGRMSHAAFSVTLGIMPDYMAEIKGLKVDGVTPDRPAERAGILKDDIIVKIGEYDVDDIYTYMNCLSKFRKGDSTVVVVQRGDKTLNLDVVFR